MKDKRLFAFLILFVMLATQLGADFAAKASTTPANDLIPWSKEVDVSLEIFGVTREEYELFHASEPLTIGSKGKYVLLLKKHLYDLDFYSSPQKNDVFTKDTQNRINKYFERYGDDNVFWNTSYKLPEGFFSQADQLYLMYVSREAVVPKQFAKLDYNTIARSVYRHEGEKYQFRATIIQQIDVPNSADSNFIVSVDGNYKRIAYLQVLGFRKWGWEIDGKTVFIRRLLEGDKIYVYGILRGEYIYSSISGQEIIAPSFEVPKLDLL